ncbi:hypothetical protein ACHAXS_014107 [Conticribra weissflogii]
MHAPIESDGTNPIEPRQATYTYIYIYIGNIYNLFKIDKRQRFRSNLISSYFLLSCNVESIRISSVSKSHSKYVKSIITHPSLATSLGTSAPSTLHIRLDGASARDGLDVAHPHRTPLEQSIRFETLDPRFGEVGLAADVAVVETTALEANVGGEDDDDDGEGDSFDIVAAATAVALDMAVVLVLVG